MLIPRRKFKVVSPVAIAFFFLFALVRCQSGNLTWTPSGDGSLSAPPTIGSVSAAKNLDGTQTVTLSGSGFVTGDIVSVEGTYCTSVTVVSSSQISCLLPSSSIPLTNIVVTPPQYVIFILSTANGNLGGLSGADSMCANAAKSTTLPLISILNHGTYHWRAILSDSVTAANARIVLTSGVSVLNSDQQTLFDASRIWTSAPSYAVNYDANGNLSSSRFTWTNTSILETYNGNKLSTSKADDCGDWTVSSSTGGNATTAGRTYKPRPKFIRWPATSLKETHTNNPCSVRALDSVFRFYSNIKNPIRTRGLLV